jgi:hypothetical protein
MVVVARFAGADRRAPLIGAAAAALAYLLWLTAVNSLADIAASDAQGALIYFWGPIFSLPVALIGGHGARAVDGLWRRMLARHESAQRLPPNP